MRPHDIDFCRKCDYHMDDCKCEVAEPEAFADKNEKVEKLYDAMRDIYEVWAGSEGVVLLTDTEKYQARLIKEMRDIAATNLRPNMPPTEEKTNGS